MKKSATWVLALLVAVQTLASQAALGDQPVRIGIVVDGPWDQNEAIQELTVREVTALTEGEFDVDFPDRAYLVGDWTLATARSNINRLLEDPEIDMVITWGLIASHAVCCLGELPKPVIAPVLLDPVLQGLPFTDGASGVHNLTYVSLPDTLAEELETFRGIVPFRHVAILATAPLLESIPELVERTRKNLAGTGVNFEYIPTRESAEEVLGALSPEVDAVYAWPLFQFSPVEYRRLIDGLIERKLPAFSGLGGGDVEAGMLASAGSPDFFPKLARRVALNIQRILLGQDAGDIPVEFSVRHNLIINMKTARAIDVSPRWEVLIEAKLLHAEDIEGAYRLSLDKAVREALEINLDLLARRRQVSAGAQEIAIARSKLRPRLEASASTVTIDDDRAAASFGSQPERSVTASASLTQLLFSEPALANLSIQKRLQEAREHDFETLRLDIALDAATTYLNLMRAKALERVQRNNVERTRSNLEQAQDRRDVGVASAGEVFRWQSELAIARKSLVEAVGDRRAAEIAVNRLLHRRLESSLVTEEVSLDTPGFVTGQERFRVFIETPKGYGVFRDFIVLEGLGRAPELRRIDAGIAAQERLAASTKRALWSPTVAFRAALDEILSRGGAGSSGSGSATLPFELPTADESSWSLAIDATLPLFTGGSRSAERIQADIDLERLRLERAAAEERIEQRVRTALVRARASFVGIRLSNQAAEAARRNLDLVEDSYSRGVASLLDLLDAQTAALNAEEQAANALYDFLIDWLEAQRASNTFDFFAGEDERREWSERLDAYVALQGISLRAADSD
ncbi:MAG: TolC family protein [Acidobacteria bacterium]|nr:TolC family protein [Acidobacteriota bacterium]